MNTSVQRAKCAININRRKGILALVMAMAAIAPPSHAQTAQKPTGQFEPSPSAIIPARQSDEALRALLEQRIADKRGMGFGVALLDPDGSTRYISVGQSGQSGRSQIDQDTVFEIGSITKAFTGSLLAQMVERGEVKLTDTVRAFAPKDANLTAGGVGDITLRQLVTHTSGLPRLPLSTDFFLSMAKGGDNPYLYYTNSMMWKYLAQRKHDVTKTYPSDYSNLGVGLLGELLANRAGMSYGELVKRNILTPVGMRDTYIDVPAAEANRFAKGHTESLVPTGYWDLPVMGAAGALRSTPRDMVAFMRAQINGSLAGARSAQTPLVRESERRQVGYAWMVTSSRGDEIIWHNGGTGGFSSFAGFSTKSGRGIVILANAAVGVDDIAMHSLNTQFPLADQKASSVDVIKSFIALGVVGMVWLGSLLSPFRAIYAVAPQADSPPRKRVFKRRYIASRFDSAWGALEIAVVAALIAIFAPWSILGSGALLGKMVLGVSAMLAGAVMLYRARTLPWQRQYATRAVTWMSRAITAVLALALVVVWV